MTYLQPTASSKKTTPRVTVLMSVYNGEAYLTQAIDSILWQTFTDFEFLIIDDCSTDSSAVILDDCAKQDPRIRVIKNEDNLGLTKSLNVGLREAKGEYIARMDSDDISLPNRLSLQVSFLDNNKDVGICGGNIRIFGELNHLYTYPYDNATLKLNLLNRSPFAHPVVCMRTSCVKKHNLYYNEDFVTAQDYELWVQFSRVTRLANIPEVLLKYRLHNRNITKVKASEQQESSAKSKIAQYSYLLGRKLNNEETQLVISDFTAAIGLTNCIQFICLLISTNNSKNYYDIKSFNCLATFKYLRYLKKNESVFVTVKKLLLFELPISRRFILNALFMRCQFYKGSC